MHERKNNNNSSDTQTSNGREHEKKDQDKLVLSKSILVSSLIIAGAWIYTSRFPAQSPRVSEQQNSVISNQKVLSAFEDSVLPLAGVVLPVRLNDLGQKLVSVGALDREKFLSLYSGTEREIARRLVDENQDEPLQITSENSAILLNLLWAVGLGNKNEILEKGEMMDSRYGGAGRFASTAGWTISDGDAMSHYSMHPFMILTDEQQALVDKVSRGIYRPCCGNATHFPDCNHGMAMLGFLELMASQGVGEQDMWKAALSVNSYWFPDTYLTIATYMKNKGVAWNDVHPEEVLGVTYSSNQGYTRIASQVATPAGSGGSGGCNVGSVASEALSQRQSASGCGI
ncbi:MAG: hypothetical protein NUV54_00025 [Candidatus Taylorbacteria bacterium]|nr:hypothetical protein [Candidatus Taylorbacteria bacterium]